MKSDALIQKDVMDQIRWNPLFTGAEIGVSVRNGIVTLSGQVDNYLKKITAEKETKRVSGVKAIAEEIRVGLSPINKRTDAEIADAALNALKAHTNIPEEEIKVKVEKGIITLEGEVDWAFQRHMAHQAVLHLTGVTAVINSINLKPRIKPEDLKQKITAALHRSATLDASRIMVEVIETRAIIKGRVRSLAEKEDAEKALWSAPGILHVDNQLAIEPAPEFAYMAE